jgi:hypothetical protein
MGRIVVSENVSLDGVAQDPTGDEGFRHGGWLDRGREEWVKVELDEALRARLVQKPCKWALCVARDGEIVNPRG